MKNHEVILKAENLGFTFKKRTDSWMWVVTAPDGDVFICEQGDKEGMTWLREKITHFI